MKSYILRIDFILMIVKVVAFFFLFSQETVILYVSALNLPY